MATVSFSPSSPSPTPCCCLPLITRDSVHAVIWGEGAGFPLHCLILTWWLSVAISSRRHLPTLGGSNAREIFSPSIPRAINHTVIQVLFCLTQLSFPLSLSLLVECHIEVRGRQASNHVLTGSREGCQAALSKSIVLATRFAKIP